MSIPTLIPLTRFSEYKVYSLDKMLIVFHQENASLHVLGDLSSWLFLSLDAGLTKTDLKKELLENNIDINLLDIAFKEINALLISSPRSEKQLYRQEYDEILTSSLSFFSKLPPLISITLLGKSFEVQSSCPNLQNYLQSISFDNRYVSNKPEDNIDFNISIEPVATSGDSKHEDTDNYQLTCNGIPIFEIEKYEYIMPILMDHMQIIAYQSFNYLLSVHSAMLTYKGKGLMLPGTSGSGKSTLAISLLAKGYQCLSDEIAVIAVDDNKLMPLPLPAAIKSGSWAVVQSDFPDIDELPVWERRDGRRSKYIVLPHIDNDVPETTVSCIVFPHYQAKKDEAELIPIDSVSALKHLTDAGYQIKDSLTANKVEQILTWISCTPAYELNYANLDDAHCLIERLMS